MALKFSNLQDYFYLSQVAMSVAMIGIAWWMLRQRGPESQFRVREADLEKERRAKTASQHRPALADAKIKSQKTRQETHKEPLRLSGIRIDGAPHEILGVRANATADQIQKAYREKMKQYHPDKVGRPGSREWEDAQKIAEALNRAKNELLISLRNS